MPRSFTAPEGDKRLTINIKTDIHKRLKMIAVLKETTVGDLVERLVLEHIKRMDEAIKDF